MKIIREVTAILALALLLVPVSFGEGQGGVLPPQSSADAAAVSASKSGAQAASGAASKSASQATVTGGDITNAPIFAPSADASSADTSSVVVETNAEGAPPVTIMASPSTAEYMVCYGLGGSSKDGAATGVWCRIEKNIYATVIADRLASLGEYVPAAVSFCDRKLNRTGYLDQDDCIKQYSEALERGARLEAEQPLVLAHNDEETEELRRQNARLRDQIRSATAALDRIERRVADTEERERRKAEEADRRWQRTLDAYEQRVEGRK